MTIDPTPFIAGGYFIIKSAPREAHHSPDLLPQRLISLSNCICPSVHVYWAWREQEALDFGIPKSKLAATHREISGFDYPNVFLTLDVAQAFINEFLSDARHLHLIGIGLHPERVADFLALKQQVYDPHAEEYRQEISGVSQIVHARLALPTGGQPLGFEVVSYDNQLGHSWLCSGLERDMVDQFNIRPNQHGLIASYKEAQQVYQWIAEDKQQGHRAEPEPYYPWLLVEYPLIASEN